MSELGFYHPSIGYWQTIDEPSNEIRATYPQGTVEIPLKPGPHYIWQGGTWVSQPVPTRVPQEVSRFQAKAALLAVGKLSLAETVVSSASPVVKLAWNEALVFRRDSPTILALASAIGLTSADLDQLFITAESIAV